MEYFSRVGRIQRRWGHGVDVATILGLGFSENYPGEDFDLFVPVPEITFPSFPRKDSQR
jgi:hypothetical protein